MNKNTIYGFVKNITPPFLFSLFKKSGAYSVAKKVTNVFAKEKYMPSWQIINSGYLKGVQLYVDPKGQWQDEMLRGVYDDFFFEYLEKQNLSGKVVYDIGAHIGFSSLFFAKMVGEKGKVITFEPNVFNIERIKQIFNKNTDLSKNIQLVEGAVSDKDGEDNFIFSSNIDNGTSSGSFIDSAHTLYDKHSYQSEGGFKSCTVKTIKLDSLITGDRADVLNSKDLAEPDIIKMDIEGSEYLALEGAKELIVREKPLILIEIHSIFNMYKVYSFLTDLGYKFELLKEENDGRCFFAASVI